MLYQAADFSICHDFTDTDLLCCRKRWVWKLGNVHFKGCRRFRLCLLSAFSDFFLSGIAFLSVSAPRRQASFLPAFVITVRLSGVRSKYQPQRLTAFHLHKIFPSPASVFEFRYSSVFRRSYKVLLPCTPTIAPASLPNSLAKLRLPMPMILGITVDIHYTGWITTIVVRPTFASEAARSLTPFCLFLIQVGLSMTPHR